VAVQSKKDKCLPSCSPLSTPILLYLSPFNNAHFSTSFSTSWARQLTARWAHTSHQIILCSSPPYLHIMYNYKTFTII
jgi:hypothetical protein